MVFVYMFGAGVPSEVYRGVSDKFRSKDLSIYERGWVLRAEHPGFGGLQGHVYRNSQAEKLQLKINQDKNTFD